MLIVGDDERERREKWRDGQKRRLAAEDGAEKRDEII